MTDDTVNPTSTPGADLGSVGGFSRRGFLIGTGAVAGAAALAACGSSSSKSSSKTTTTKKAAGTTSTAAAGGAGGDLATAAFAASLEVLAVNTYKAALAAATANKLGPVPAAGANFVQTAITQHSAALDKWNGVLSAAGKPAVTAPDAKLNATVQTEFAKVTDFGGAAKLALQLEQIAAATYQNAVASLTGKDAIQLAGSIQIVDMQHQAILNYVLGMYPVPDTFAKTDMAASPS
ncbi:MAG: Ferritin-like protein [Actinomycetia bacterium]|nr:Ferritin-like protein [Actinomycetes bacterium]